MTHIIAGRLQQQDQIQQAIIRFLAAGFAQDQISSFYVNPAGQHDLFAVGGDRDESPGARKVGEGAAGGAAAGGVVGAAMGIAGTVVAGPAGTVVGALVGAHIGSLVGGLSQMKDKGEVEPGGDNTHAHRKSGMLIAVGVSEPARENDAVAILRDLGADQIERAEGIISDGDWRDFDPLASPRLLGATAGPAES